MPYSEEQIKKASGKSAVGFTAQMLGSGIPAPRAAALLKRAQQVGADTAARQAKLAQVILDKLPALRGAAAPAAA